MDLSASVTTLGPRPAGGLRRFMAALLDLVILVVLFKPYYDILSPFLEAKSILFLTTRLSATFVGYYGIVNSYFLVFPLLFGRTPGKMVLRLCIERHQGGTPSWWQLLLRVLGYHVSLFCLGLGFVLAFAREDQRTLHDLIAGTQVVREL